MKIILFVLAASLTLAQGTYTAASCNRSDVNAVINGPTHTAVNGDTIIIPAGTCTWTSGITVTGVGINITGRGTPNTGPSTVGAGTPTTTIIDNTAASLITVTGVPFGQTMKVELLNLQAQISSTLPPLWFVGTCSSSGCPNLRVDNINFVTGWNGKIPASGLTLSNNFYAVFDHNSANESNVGNPALVQNHFGSWLGVGGYGDNSFASPDSYGTNAAVYIENNSFNGISGTENDVGSSSTGAGGSRYVCRFNTFNNLPGAGACSAHGTSWLGRERGQRQLEVYGNTVSITGVGDSGQGINSGTGLVFGNSWTGFINKVVNLDVPRDWHSDTPWNYCDGSQPWDTNDTNGGGGNTAFVYASGTITTGGSSTTLSDNSKSWTVNQWQSNGNPYSIHDVTRGAGSDILSNTATQYTVNNGNGYLTWGVGDSYQILRANICMDQTGRSGGTLYSGSSPSPSSAASQTLDPIYEWSDTVSGGAAPVSSGSVRLLPNRDYYNETHNQTAQTSPTSPFNGTSGTGHGTLANRPTTCTSRVGYWATDQGNWNQSGNGFGQGMLFVCTATNTWTTYYTPYTYPHPLTTSIPSDDEFVGPFSSWTNLVTSYGSTNAAIQTALNELGTPGHKHNLWVPCGTYTITTTLTITSKEGISVIGANPDCVTFLLSGAGPLLHVNGVDYSRFNRITFDGGGNTSAILIQQSNNSGAFFDTGNEYADDVFQNAGTGFQCGWMVNGCSEISILRDHFTNLAASGVFVGNYNALDIWVRYSVFTNCNVAIGNYDGTNVGAGNFHAYNSNFFSSTTAHIDIANTTPFSFRGNYFSGSPYAILGAGTGNPAPMTIQNNTFIDQTTQAVNMGNQGPVLFMDNAVRQASVTLPSAYISVDGVAQSNQFTLGPNPISAGTRLFEADTTIVSAGSINATPPVLPGTPPNVGRTIFEVAPGASTATIQTAINNAVALNGSRPVVHMQEGTYSITAPLNIPANSDLQLICDGSFATILNWAGTGAGPVIRITGPSHATLRECKINASLQVDAIGASGIDQVGSRVFLQEVQTAADGLAANANIFYDQLDNTVLEVQDSSHSASTGTGVKVVGGPLAAAGTPAGGQVRYWDGSGGGEILPYSVSGGGTLLLRDYWNESQGPAIANISGRALVTIDGLHGNVNGNIGQSTPGVSISGLIGKTSILTSNNQDRTVISGSGSSTQVLQSAGDQDCTVINPYFIDSTSPAGTSGLLNHRECNTIVPGTGSLATANTGTVSSAFVLAMLAQDRAAVQAPITVLPNNVTDLRMYRMSTNRGINGIHLSGGPCSTDATGWCVTGLSAVQNNILGPLTPYGSNPWIFGDLAESGTADNMATKALAQAPALGTALAGTVSHISGTQTITTTADLTVPLAGQSWVAIAWNSIDGTATGRALCPIGSVTSTTITCQENMQEPDFSGVTAYLLPPAVTLGGQQISFESWTTENPSVVWNYYDVGIALYRLYYRTLNATYLTQAQAYADIQWQWVLDHGYRSVAPRASAMLGQFFRVGEGHAERLPGLYNWIAFQVPRWANLTVPFSDVRESGYILWSIALGAKVDTDPTRHAQYCSWLTTYTPRWNSQQYADGSWGSDVFSQNPFYVSAPKSFTPPFLYVAYPWNMMSAIKGLQAAYESLNDTSSQGCNNTSLAATTLSTTTKAITYQNNYGRDTANRGIYYEVNSQSDDQDSVPVNGSPAAGTVSVSLSSTAVTGVGTNWNTAGYCDGTHFIGFLTTSTIYKIASCSSNTAMVISVAFGLYSEMSSISGGTYRIAPAAFTGCHSSATYCFGSVGDRNLTRTVCGGMGWLYYQTHNVLYKSWTDECLSATLGGPTSGLTSAAVIGSTTLPCSGPNCDGLVTDMVAAAADCGSSPVPCISGSYVYTNLGKNYGEAWGAPGIDNALAWRLTPAAPVAPTITSTSPLPNGATGVAYSYQFTATGTQTISWSGTGLPAWASLSSTGLLTGTPSVAAVSTLMITATNPGGATGPQSFSLTVTASGTAPTITSTSPLTNGTVSVAYSYQFTATGTAPITWSATGLPAWATLSSAGLLTGTPNAAAVSTLHVTATNGTGSAGPTDFSLTISGVAPPLPTCSPKTHVTPPTATDVQYQTNMALGIIACTNSLTQTGTCTVVDVQRVVNATLGQACVIGP